MAVHRIEKDVAERRRYDDSDRSLLPVKTKTLLFAVGIVYGAFWGSALIWYGLSKKGRRIRAPR
jgi:hypothetical protein